MILVLVANTCETFHSNKAIYGKVLIIYRGTENSILAYTAGQKSLQVATMHSHFIRETKPFLVFSEALSNGTMPGKQRRVLIMVWYVVPINVW